MEDKKKTLIWVVVIAIFLILFSIVSGDDESPSSGKDNGANGSYICSNCGGDGWDSANDCRCVWCGGDGQTSWNP